MIKKVTKKIFFILILLPIIIYIGVVIGNNCIADNIEKDLKQIELSNNTEIVDSFSTAGKITGNGNGMQYFGAILVSSDLSEAELKEYYQEYSKDIYVVKQETSYIFDSTYYPECKFENFDESENNYMVYRWEYNSSHYEKNDFISELLDLDLRGH